MVVVVVVCGMVFDDVGDVGIFIVFDVYGEQYVVQQFVGRIDEGFVLLIFVVVWVFVDEELFGFFIVYVEDGIFVVFVQFVVVVFSNLLFELWLVYGFDVGNYGVDGWGVFFVVVVWDQYWFQ